MSIGVVVFAVFLEHSQLTYFLEHHECKKGRDVLLRRLFNIFKMSQHLSASLMSQQNCVLLQLSALVYAYLIQMCANVHRVISGNAVMLYSSTLDVAGFIFPI